jgi:microcystin-dependent protein
MSNPFIGETRTFAFGFAPAGWLPCNGQLLPVEEYEALFTLIGTTYGGDGESTFALPKAAGPESGDKALSVCISLFGSYPPR